jgi:hypothetical protein
LSILDSWTLDDGLWDELGVMEFDDQGQASSLRVRLLRRNNPYQAQHHNFATMRTTQ